MSDLNHTPEAVASMASRLLAAGQEEAATMLSSLLTQALAAERELHELRRGASAEASPTATRAVTETDPPVGESLEEISQGRHVGP